MKVLLDTSILVAALFQNHASHALAIEWLRRAQKQELRAVIAAHTLAEVYAVLTRLPVKPPISSATAWAALQTEVLPYVEVIALSADEYRDAVEQLAARNIGGGQTYDALIAKAALVAEADHLVTLNARHFRAVSADIAARVIDPSETAAD